MPYKILAGVKGLIFDLDGTLVDSMPFHFEGWKKACKRYGAHIDNTFLRKHTGSPGWFIAEAILKKSNLNNGVTVEEILKMKTEEFFRVQHLVKPIKPVVDIVKAYHGLLPMAVGTGGHREAVERTLEYTGLNKYFDIIVTANDVDNYKPHPETFLRCASMMGVEASDIEVFEDGELGLEAARQAGMKATDVRSWYDSDW